MANYDIEKLKKVADIVWKIGTGIVGMAALAGIVKISNKGENSREDIEYMDEDFGQKYGWKKWYNLKTGDKINGKIGRYKHNRKYCYRVSKISRSVSI